MRAGIFSTFEMIRHFHVLRRLSPKRQELPSKVNIVASRSVKGKQADVLLQFGFRCAYSKASGNLDYRLVRFDIGNIAHER